MESKYSDDTAYLTESRAKVIIKEVITEYLKDDYYTKAEIDEKLENSQSE